MLISIPLIRVEMIFEAGLWYVMSQQPLEGELRLCIANVRWQGVPLVDR